MEQLWHFWLLVDEPLGTVLGFVIVWCLIRQNLWAWPLGVAYVIVSVTVLLEARLYANLALHVLGFLPMNLYGWYYWLFGKAPEEAELPVTRSSPRLMLGVLAICVVGAAVLGTAFAVYTNAALPYWDNSVFLASLAAMWLTARKKIENWIFWLVIDVVSVGEYWVQGLPLYAFLYFVYVGMAVAGWRSWKRSMEEHVPLWERSPDRDLPV
jgi:nicotinamide mononucleotide transporter